MRNAEVPSDTNAELESNCEQAVNGGAGTQHLQTNGEVDVDTTEGDLISGYEDGASKHLSPEMCAENDLIAAASAQDVDEIDINDEFMQCRKIGAIKQRSSDSKTKQCTRNWSGGQPPSAQSETLA
jgi:hypothetical protein